MALPKISIIIPVYNVEPYIAECLCSVMRQTYVGPIECVLVDDCGTDKSVEIADKLIEEYKGPIEFRLLHHEKNLGLSCARNTGIDAAKGEYVYFLDSDDVITDDCLEVLASLIEKGGFDVVVGNNDEFGDREKAGYLIREGGEALNGEDYVLRYLNGFQLPEAAWNKLYRLSYLMQRGPYFVPGILLEDQVYNFMLSCYPTRMFVTNALTHHYRVRKDSIVDQLTTNPLLLRDTCVRVWYSFLKNCKPESYVEAQELCLQIYGTRIFLISKDNGLLYRELFFQMHRQYPYKPLRIWLSKKQGFRWFISRLYWSLPPFLGLYWLKLKWMIKGVFYARQYQ